MGENQAHFCNACGTPFAENQTFCTKCGSKRSAFTPRAGGPAQQSPTAAAPPPRRGVVATASGAVAAASVARSTVATVAGVAGVGVALPWQTVVGNQPVDVAPFLAAAASPLARRAVNSSLKRPGIALLVTTVLDLLIAVITGGVGAIGSVLPRFLLTGATSALSLATGSKGGAMRTATGALSLLTALIQLVSVGWAVVAGISAGASLWTVLPSVIAMMSSLVMAIKTALVALRRRA